MGKGGYFRKLGKGGFMKAANPQKTTLDVLKERFWAELAETQTCPKCNKSYPKDDFGMRVLTGKMGLPKIGRQSYCKWCRSNKTPPAQTEFTVTIPDGVCRLPTSVDPTNPANSKNWVKLYPDIHANTIKALADIQMQYGCKAPDQRIIAFLESIQLCKTESAALEASVKVINKYHVWVLANGFTRTQGT
jgi:hypothetical protein